MRPRRLAGVLTHRHTAENTWNAIAHATSMRTTIHTKVRDSAHPSSGGRAIIVHAPCWSEIQPLRCNSRMRELLCCRVCGCLWVRPRVLPWDVFGARAEAGRVVGAALCIPLV